jgi:ferric-dicitrate binding protein FerR (iron transport regulator)
MMKNLQPNLFLIYYKRKDSMPLMQDEQHAWEQYRLEHPQDNTIDEEAIERQARDEQKKLPAEQYLAKYKVQPLSLPFPKQKQDATVLVRNLRRMAVAASFAAALVGAWWFSPLHKSGRGIEPGFAQATLQLADGNTLALDTVTQGLLAHQGNVDALNEQPGILHYQYIPGNTQPAAGWNRLEAPKGGEYQLVLADGTKVWLNAATVLRYPTTFGAGAREVVLEEGEAFFEVTKKAGQPFVVIISSASPIPRSSLPGGNGGSNNPRIEVLGTQFNVKAYKAEAITTSLVEGSVRIMQGNQQQVLTPGQQAIIDNQGTLRIANANLKDVTAWKNKYFSYTNTRLSEIMAAVQRWYNVEVSYSDPLSDDRFYVDDFPRSKPVDQLLDNLAASRLVHFEIKGRKIYISKKSNVP